VYKHRIKILLLAASLIAVALISRLADLEIRNVDRFRESLETQQLPPFKPIPAARGRILARGAGGEGTVELVANEPAFELAVYYPVMDADRWWINGEVRRIRKKVKADTQPGRPIRAERAELRRQIQTLWQEISKVTHIPLDELAARRDGIVKIVQQIVTSVEQRQREKGNLGEEDKLDYPILEQRMFYPIVTDLDEPAKVELQLGPASHRWTRIRPGCSRAFRRGHTLCHILGRTTRIPGSVAKTRDIRDYDYIPGEMQGRSGLEEAYERILKGKHGWVRLADPAVIDPMPVDGSDLVLTIDIALQEYAENRLREQVEELDYATAGAAVVIDLSDQRLLALASVPTYDPAEYSSKYKQLSSDLKSLPLLNRALTVRYCPGSIVKPIVAEIAFDCHAISPTTTFECTGRLFPGRNAYRCWRPPPGHGQLGVVEAISQSCDVFFYNVGERIGAARLARYYRMFGLADKPAGIMLPCNAGLVPTQQWFHRQHGRAMSVGDARNLAVGQGDLQITPLHAAVMFSALLTGTLRPVRLVANDELPQPVELDLNRDAVNLVLEGMEKTVTAETGTGHKYAYTDEIRLAGKTGSAQAPGRAIRWRIEYTDAGGTVHTEQTDNRYQRVRELQAKDSEITNLSVITIAWYPVLKKEHRFYHADPDRPNRPAHAWFVGYAPASNAKVVIAVMIEYGMSGGRAAGPVFRDLALKCRELGYLR